MNCRVLLGDEVLFNGAARLVVARSDDGEFAIMDGHEAMLAALRPGPLRIETETGSRVFQLADALLRVSPEGVTVVAAGSPPVGEDAEPGDEAVSRAEDRDD